MSWQTGGNGGSPNGRNGIGRGDGDYSLVAGGKGFAIKTPLTDGDYGAGGHGSYSTGEDRWWHCGTGGSGGWKQTTIKVTPGQEITIIVGEGGHNAFAGAGSFSGRYAKECSNVYGNISNIQSGNFGSRAWTATNGSSGFVLVEYGGDI